MPPLLMRCVWVVGSFVGIALVGAASATVVPLLWRLQSGAVFSSALLVSPAWWIADGLAVALLSLIGLTGLPSVRRLVTSAVVSFLTYVVVGSVSSSLDAIGSYDADVAGSGWGSAFTWAVLMSVVLVGNGWAAFIVPVVLGLLPPFRRWLVGAPIVWAVHRYGLADDDAAAEDFGIY